MPTFTHDQLRVILEIIDIKVRRVIDQNDHPNDTPRNERLDREAENEIACIITMATATDGEYE